jgi:uncharacterized protein YqgV (UPF0045/DUF77 family)
MRVEAEFTTEPFRGEGEPPAYVTEAFAAAQATGVECELGPLGTSVSGDEQDVLAALTAAMSAALAHGAETVTLQLRRSGAGAGPRPRGGLEQLLADVASELGAPLRDLARADKQRAVRMLEERGAFAYRKSAETVAEALGVSRFTVYNYLNRAR